MRRLALLLTCALAACGGEPQRLPVTLDPDAGPAADTGSNPRDGGSATDSGTGCPGTW